MSRITPSEKQPPSTPRTDFGEKVKAHQRYYLENGTQVPGITTIIGVLAKPALIPWANKLGLQGISTEKYIDETAAIGTLAHALVMENLGGKAVRLEDFTADQLTRGRYGVAVFQGWLKSHQLRPLLIEQPLVSEIYRYGGTLDLVAEVDGQVELIELKTSSGIWPEHEIQIGAQWRLLAEAGQEIKGARILRIGRTEGEGMDERILSGPQVLNAWRVFEHCLEIYRLKKR